MTEPNFDALSGDTLYEWNGKWIKRYPLSRYIKKTELPARQQNAAWFQLANIDDSTLLLSLPNFDGNNKSLVDNLINSNRDKLLSTPYLIIDMRGNGGGTDPTFSSVLPFLYTNPVELKGNDVLASKENINEFEKLFNSNAMSGDLKEWGKSIINRMKANPGKFVVYAADNTVRFDVVTQNPRKIGILINHNCASSAEQFLLFARECKKVVLFGQPTSGTLDYSNVLTVQCPSPAFNFGHATTKTHMLPNFSVDKEKIKPNVYLSGDKNWIEEAVKQLKDNK